MYRYSQRLTLLQLSYLLDLPSGDTILYLDYNPATRSVFLGITGGPTDVPDGDEAPVLPPGYPEN